MLTVIVPTRNRPDDLGKAISSIIDQIRKPDELIIVDQSLGDESRNIVEYLLLDKKQINLNYIHDPSIPGLVAAKQAGVYKANGDLICFLEDDVVLEKEYLYQIEKGFYSTPEMLGCCGIVTNPPVRGGLYNMLFKVFRRGIFADPRVDIFGSVTEYNQKLILSDVLSGGLSAWKANVFKVVPFDAVNGFFMVEDMEFSTRVAKHFGHVLFINPNARLAHHFSKVNRDVKWQRQRRKIVEYFTYYKKRKDWSGAHFDMLFLLLGVLGESIYHVFSTRSIKPLISLALGIKDGVLKKLIHNIQIEV